MKVASKNECSVPFNTSVLDAPIVSLPLEVRSKILDSSAVNNDDIEKETFPKGSAPKSQQLRYIPGAIVEALWGDGLDAKYPDWYLAKVVSFNQKVGTLHLRYDDGSVDDAVPLSRVRIKGDHIISNVTKPLSISDNKRRDSTHSSDCTSQTLKVQVREENEGEKLIKKRKLETVKRKGNCEAKNVKKQHTCPNCTRIFRSRYVLNRHLTHCNGGETYGIKYTAFSDSSIEKNEFGKNKPLNETGHESLSSPKLPPLDSHSSALSRNCNAKREPGKIKNTFSTPQRRSARQAMKVVKELEKAEEAKRMKCVKALQDSKIALENAISNAVRAQNSVSRLISSLENQGKNKNEKDTITIAPAPVQRVKRKRGRPKKLSSSSSSTKTILNEEKEKRKRIKPTFSNNNSNNVLESIKNGIVKVRKRKKSLIASKKNVKATKSNTLKKRKKSNVKKILNENENETLTCKEENWEGDSPTWITRWMEGWWRPSAWMKGCGEMTPQQIAFEIVSSFDVVLDAKNLLHSEYVSFVIQSLFLNWLCHSNCLRSALDLSKWTSHQLFPNLLTERKDDEVVTNRREANGHIWFSPSGEMVKATALSMAHIYTQRVWEYIFEIQSSAYLNSTMVMTNPSQENFVLELCSNGTGHLAFVPDTTGSSCFERTGYAKKRLRRSGNAAASSIRHSQLLAQLRAGTAGPLTLVKCEWLGVKEKKDIDYSDDNSNTKNGKNHFNLNQSAGFGENNYIMNRTKSITNQKYVSSFFSSVKSFNAKNPFGESFKERGKSLHFRPFSILVKKLRCNLQPTYSELRNEKREKKRVDALKSNSLISQSRSLFQQNKNFVDTLYGFGTRLSEKSKIMNSTIVKLLNWTLANGLHPHLYLPKLEETKGLPGLPDRKLGWNEFRKLIRLRNLKYFPEQKYYKMHNKSYETIRKKKMSSSTNDRRGEGVLCSSIPSPSPSKKISSSHYSLSYSSSSSLEGKNTNRNENKNSKGKDGNTCKKVKSKMKRRNSMRKKLKKSLVGGTPVMNISKAASDANNSITGESEAFAIAKSEREHVRRATMRKMGIPDSQPFAVWVNPDATFLCDFHSHLANSEIIGLLGGQWIPEEERIVIEAAFPIRALDIGEDVHVNVEMDPASELQIRAVIAARKLRVVGWYHSHPTFQTDPSVRDIQNQMSYQSLFRDQRHSVEPFIGLIVGPYDLSLPAEQSNLQFFYTREEGPSGGAAGMPVHCVPGFTQYRQKENGNHKRNQEIDLYYWKLLGGQILEKNNVPEAILLENKKIVANLCEKAVELIKDPVLQFPLSSPLIPSSCLVTKHSVNDEAVNDAIPMNNNVVTNSLPANDVTVGLPPVPFRTKPEATGALLQLTTKFEGAKSLKASDPMNLNVHSNVIFGKLVSQDAKLKESDPIVTNGIVTNVSSGKEDILYCSDGKRKRGIDSEILGPQNKKTKSNIHSTELLQQLHLFQLNSNQVNKFNSNPSPSVVQPSPPQHMIEIQRNHAETMYLLNKLRRLRARRKKNEKKMEKSAIEIDFKDIEFIHSVISASNKSKKMNEKCKNCALSDDDYLKFENYCKQRLYNLR
eukprot:g2332.t1